MCRFDSYGILVNRFEYMRGCQEPAAFLDREAGSDGLVDVGGDDEKYRLSRAERVSLHVTSGIRGSSTSTTPKDSLLSVFVSASLLSILRTSMS